MGGKLALTVRMEDNTTYKSDSWSMGTESYLNNVDLLHNQVGHTQAFIADRRFVTPNTHLSPMGYGLIVVHMERKVILDYCDALSVGKMSALLAAQDIRQFVMPEGASTIIGKVVREQPMARWIEALSKRNESVDMHARLGDFYNAGLVTSAYYPSSDGDAPIEVPSTVEGLIEALQAEYDIDHSKSGLRFGLDMSPFSVQKFTDPEKAKTAVKELGFALNTEEERRWTDWGRYNRGEIDSLDF